MIEQIFGARPVDGSAGQALSDKILSLLASFPWNTWEFNLEIDYRLVNVRSPDLVEGLLPSKDLESNAANSPDVHLFVMLFPIVSICELWSFIAGGSQVVRESVVALN